MTIDPKKIEEWKAAVASAGDIRVSDDARDCRLAALVSGAYAGPDAK